MGRFSNYAEKAILLEKGKMIIMATATEAVHQYYHLTRQNKFYDVSNFKGTLNPILEFKQIIINGNKSSEDTIIAPSSKIELKVTGECKKDLPNFRITFSVYRDGIRLFSQHDVAEPEMLPKGYFESRIEVPPFFLRPGEYSVAIGGYQDGASEWIWGTDLVTFFVSEEWGKGNDFNNVGLINLPCIGKRSIIK